jgi:ribosomal protein S18 acetylase RimI-like enzyme
MIEDLVEIRAAETPDMNFIMQSWLRAQRTHEPFYKQIDKEIYYQQHGKLIDVAIQRSYTLIASPRKHPNIIVAYIVWENVGDNNIIHYIYVKGDYRRMGIAQLLMDTVKTDRLPVTSATRSFIKIPFNPYLLG